MFQRFQFRCFHNDNTIFFYFNIAEKIQASIIMVLKSFTNKVSVFHFCIIYAFIVGEAHYDMSNDVKNKATVKKACYVTYLIVATMQGY